MTLDEILAEGKRINVPNWTGPRGYRDVWWVEHGPTLLRVAEAAVEFERTAEAWLAMPDDSSEATEAAWVVMNDAREALFAAVRGDRLPQPDEQEGAE